MRHFSEETIEKLLGTTIPYDFICIVDFSPLPDIGILKWR